MKQIQQIVHQQQTEFGRVFRGGGSFPIYDEKIKNTIRQIIELQLDDNVKARVIDVEHSNHYVKREGKAVRAQVETYRYLTVMVGGEW